MISLSLLFFSGLCLGGPGPFSFVVQLFFWLMFVTHIGVPVELFVCFGVSPLFSEMCDSNVQYGETKNMVGKRECFFVSLFIVAWMWIPVSSGACEVYS